MTVVMQAEFQSNAGSTKDTHTPLKHGVSLVKFFENMDHVILAQHWIWIPKMAITVPADVPPSNSAGTSADTVLMSEKICLLPLFFISMVFHILHQMRQVLMIDKILQIILAFYVSVMFILVTWACCSNHNWDQYGNCDLFISTSEAVISLHRTTQWHWLCYE